MRVKTLLGLLVLAHGLAHPLAHALPLLAAHAEQAQAPASSTPTKARLASSVPCPACLAHRIVPAAPLLVSASQAEWEPAAPAPPLRILSTFLLARPARAPPLA